MKRLYNNYRTAMKSLKSYLRQDWELRQSNRAQPGHVLSPEQEEAEHRQLMAFNDAENARMAAEAEQRLAEQTEAVRRKVAALQQAALEQQKKDSQRAVELIRTQEEISRMYIPRDKLEEEIEKALADEVDYNYAIDKDGTRYEGRLARPS
ncbi:probable 28S ribosomal protein S26, mitochondrial [Pollicipes pollicipes]|nr:probable 28S ribosomal protein S26, mitochondrial [Pollicipes pollicipes]